MPEEIKGLSLALKGVNHPDYPIPPWVTVLEMSEDWSIPPWQVENEASQEWVERWLCYRSELAKEQKRKSKETERKTRRR